MPYVYNDIDELSDAFTSGKVTSFDKFIIDDLVFKDPEINAPPPTGGNMELHMDLKSTDAQLTFIWRWVGGFAVPHEVTLVHSICAPVDQDVCPLPHGTAIIGSTQIPVEFIDDGEDELCADIGDVVVTSALVPVIIGNRQLLLTRDPLGGDYVVIPRMTIESESLSGELVVNNVRPRLTPTISCHCLKLRKDHLSS